MCLIVLGCLSLCYMCIYLFDCYSMYMFFANKEFIHSFNILRNEPLVLQTCVLFKWKWYLFRTNVLFVCLFVWWCLTPLLTIFPLYHGDQFYWWRKPEDPEKNHRPVASHRQTSSHNVVHLVLIEIWTHNISGGR